MEKIRILLAEDHVVVRESIKQLLSREPDLEVVGEAGDGEQAVQMVNRLSPDVLVLDVAMPKVNGIEATKRIKQSKPSTAILILTAYDYDQYIFALLEAGAAGYLLKDVSGQELINAIRSVHRGDSVLHPTVAKKVMQRFRSPLRGSEGRGADLLTEREMEVLKLAANGKSNKEIAEELVLSVRTVEAHLGNIFNKLGVGSRTEAIIHALKKGWVELEQVNTD
ncbi:MAG: response regulator transcription factor [Dehalococcoidia bacterium]|nr:response regulator transcription factor [Dehalococcoidia bacterium]